MVSAHDILIDTTGSSCPMPATLSKNALNAMSSGQILKLIVGRNEDVVRNIRTLVANNQYELMIEARVDSRFIFHIRKH